MPLDAIFLTALTDEVRQSALGARIDKIQMPERDTLVLGLRGPAGSRKLLIHAGTGSARVCFTQQQYENPPQPPMFCMLLRKYITGARILSVTQPPMERLVDFELDTLDAMGVSCRRHLIAELMGSYSNIILTDPQGIVTDCLHRIDSAMSEKRMLLPGLLYRLPPQPDKLLLPDLTDERLAALAAQVSGDMAADKWILSTFTGISPLIARELVYSVCADTDARMSAVDRAALARALGALRDMAAGGGLAPYLLLEQDGRCADFTFLPVRQYGSLRTAERQESFSALLEAYYARRDQAERMRRRSQELLRTVKTARDRTRRRLNQQYQELEKAGGRERLREDADIIMANLHLMEKGVTLLRAEDFYAPGGGVREIRLNPAKSPRENAAALYREYSKRKTAEQMLTELTAAGEKELDYLESVLEELERAERESDLSEIRAELTDAGYIRAQKGKKEKRTASKPMRFVSDTGMEFYAGRNNAQNDALTLRTAFKSDVWLHTRKIHGSHVVIACRAGARPDETTLRQAAAVAAWYSRARESRNVPVDYTEVRFVKKPAGARPGMVIYTNQRTVYADPDGALAQRLMKT